MKAWLITWVFTGESTERRDPFIAIFSARKSEKSVADFVEYYHLLMTLSAKEVAYFVNRPSKIPYKATTVGQFNGIPHAGRIACGNSPSIYARLVSDLVVSHPDDDWTVETIRWKEPPVFKWEDDNKYEVALAREGEVKEFTRNVRYRVDDIAPLP